VVALWRPNPRPGEEADEIARSIEGLAAARVLGAASAPRRSLLDAYTRKVLRKLKGTARSTTGTHSRPTRRILADRAIFDWGVNETLLDIVEAYLGRLAAYDGFNLFYTKADGRRVLKIAVYAYGGPLQVLKTAAPEFESAAAYPISTGERLARRLGRQLDNETVTTCTGPAGTVIFAETALRYHRGKPATARPGETFRHGSSALQESAFARCL
jgi:hypothetical protein